MDWNAVADQLAKGQKLYEAFKEGSELASRLASFERYNSELQSKADLLPPQIEQAKQELAAVQTQVEQARAEAAVQEGAWHRDYEAAHLKRVGEAQIELDAWWAKIAAQAQAYQAQMKDYQGQVDQLKAMLTDLQGQIDSLKQIKISLKSQLQGVA